MEIHQAVKDMLEIVDQLQKTYPKKKFTLDGRLVGDLGEILVEEDYNIDLYVGLEKRARWRILRWPASPNQNDYEKFADFSGGSYSRLLYRNTNSRRWRL